MSSVNRRPIDSSSVASFIHSTPLAPPPLLPNHHRPNQHLLLPSPRSFSSFLFLFFYIYIYFFFKIFGRLLLFCFRPLRPHGGASTSVRVCVCVCVCVCSFCFIEHGFISRFYSRRWPLVGWWVPFSVLVHKGYCLSKLFFFSSSSSLFNALVCA